VVREVLRPDVSSTLRLALESVVTEGTGKLALVPGFRVGGKTGTAHKVVNGAYCDDKHYASFIGFLPVQEPEFIVSIVVDEPVTKHYGGEVASPAFQRVASRVAECLNLVPMGPDALLAERSLP
jgi:cell division protein FtsI/penicillin-binding protein 2